MVDFKFIFDFGSPKTYLVYKLLPGIEKSTKTKAEYVPVLLGGIFKSTNNVSPIESFKTVPAKGKYDAIVIAVAHDRFKDYSPNEIKDFGKDNHVIYDIKYLLSADHVDGRL